MNQHNPTDVPLLAPVDPDMLKLLTKGAPDALKSCLVAKQDKIQRDVSRNELANLTQALR